MTSKVSLDREDPLILNNGGLYTFSIRAQEKDGQATVSQVTVVVTDVDDQRPVFSENEIHVTVLEDIADGTPLPGLNLVVSDGDVGENARFSLHIEDIFGSKGVFSIFPETAVGRTPVIIKVADSSRLDFEDPDSSKFLFKVIASEGGEPVSAAVINVTVADANDNAPVFESSSCRYSVSESVSSGYLINTLLANDSDSGVFGEIRYSLKGFGAEKFRVDDITGEIFVANCGQEMCLDYERQKTYSLTYSATDGGGKITSVNIFIDILDENDNAPRFSRREYRRTVDEGAAAFDPPLFVKATDDDGETQGGGKVFYTIQEGNTPDKAFFIEPINGEVSIQRPLSYIDTPTSTYTLTVRATDAGEPTRQSDIRVYITVGRDTNRPPRFKQREYHANIPEDSKAGTSILQVSADDPDGDNEAVTYALTAGARDNFVMNATSGEITVAKGASLDRDITPSYLLVVAAIDSGSQTRQTSTTTVTVDLMDVNNKAPKFSQESYVKYVSERLPVGESVLTVSAVDLDLDANLVYEITRPVMARDKTGVALLPSSTYDYFGAFR
ncbi:hypothetical protein SK128_010007 [Halocaridina rubra]|uniref:Cadherin domain-containing protein n=1 Tax=Halocaridina rubra TaxID=373956 RepID=A0AAN8XFP3_HALRR